MRGAVADYLRGVTVEPSPVTQAVLLVGGLGTRLRPLTYHLPKALMPLANLPLIAYEIIPLVRAGVKRLVFAMGYKAEVLREQLGDGEEWGAEFIYVEETEPLDTAGALANVAEHLDGTFFACNGDMVYDVDLVSLARAHVDREALITFCLRQTVDIQHFGLIQWQDDGRVTAFREKTARDETGRNTVNSGFYVMSQKVLEHIPRGTPYSNEKQLFPELLEQGWRLMAHLPARSGYWADVGRIETYLSANGDILEGALSWFAPSVRCAQVGTQVAATADVAADVVVERGAVIGPRVAIGAGCRIGAGAVLRDSILWAGSQIGEGAALQNSVVAGAVVAPGRQVISEVIVP